jgi:hypothetical protein
MFPYELERADGGGLWKVPVPQGISSPVVWRNDATTEPAQATARVSADTLLFSPLEHNERHRLTRQSDFHRG